jgi:hypothetical protein
MTIAEILPLPVSVARVKMTYFSVIQSVAKNLKPPSDEGGGAA